jgi:hypothetical protein
VPAGDFGVKLFFAGSGELVEARAAAGVFGGPFGADPAGLFHAVKGGVKRADLGVEDVAGDSLDGRHDGIAVELWLAGEDFEDEKVEGALHRVCLFHTKTSYYIDGLVVVKSEGGSLIL